MFTKRRPVDQLQLLFEMCKSGSGEAIEGFFKLHSVSDLHCQWGNSSNTMQYMYF